MRHPALVRTIRSPVRVLSWLLPVLFVLAVSAAPAGAKKPVYASIVVDANTGEVLHAVNADARTYPASTTKIMTLYLLFEALERGKLKMETPLRVSDRAAAQQPSKLGVEAGRYVSVRDAMLALVTKSANDMAVVVAEALAGSEEAFAEQMTRRARALGMRTTRFKNASGLPDPDQVTTARELATLGMAVLRDFPRQYQVFSVHDFTYEGIVHNNHNKLLTRYPGVDGIKTGYIRASGFNLVASAERDGRRLVAVVLGGNAPGWRDVHMAQLLDKAFDKRPAVMMAKADPRQAAPIAREIKRRPGPPAPEPVIATTEPPPPAPAYTEESDTDEPTIADLISDDAAEAIAASGQWGVQVGAYKQQDSARRAVDDARRMLGSMLNGARPAIEETKGRGGNLYQARLVGMTESEARNACRAFKKKKLACIAVPPPVPNGRAQQSAQGSK